MSMKMYNDTDIQDIANAIRSKNGSSATYKTSQMGAAIRALPTSGKAVSSVTCTTTTTNGAYIGDANGDGVIDSNDQQLVARYDVDPSVTIDLKAADINGDGEVDSADNIILSRLLDTMTAGQLIARVTIGYDDGSSENRMFNVDAPSLPSNIQAFNAGSYTPAGNITSSSGATITHGLGVVPDLIVFYTTDIPWQNSIGTTGAILGCVAFVNGSTSTSMAYKNILFRAGTNGSFSSPTYNSTTYGIGATPTTTSFTVKCGTNYKLIGGDTYQWIAVKFK